MPELVFFRRGDEVLRVSLDRPRTVLGRGEQADVVIPDPQVSKAQVALIFDGQGVEVEDLSGKGTLVSGSPIARGPLPDGGDIALGQWRAVLRQRSSPEHDPAAEEIRQTEVQQGTEGPKRWQAAQLKIRQGQSERVVPLQGESFTIGKDPGNDLIVSDRFISGRHLKLVRRDGSFQVIDRSSTNGTFIGNARIFEAEVPLSTTLKIGETELTLEPVASAKKEAPSFHGIIGSDPAVRQLADLIEKVAPSNAAIAVFGESGTGKELVAKAIHARSLRSDKPFVPVNCAAISKELIESELFGHEKGSFTGATNPRKGAFEEADTGTLFLDEIGELSADLQAKLLRALESGEIKRVGSSRPMTVDVRIIAATNRDLLAQAREGKFREDLYYRLCVVPVHLPPLRNRRSDVAQLAEHFLKAFTPRGQSVKLTSQAIERLAAHTWPGNVRELRNVIHRALLLRRGPTIDASDLSFDQEGSRQSGIAVPETSPGTSLEQMLEKVERQIVENTLKRFNNNRERVAKELGVARSTLFKRLKDWGLTRQDEAE